METEQTIWCVECKKDVQARLTTGKEIYPERHDLHYLPFWICDECKNYVGCHHKTNDRTRPLGAIPNSLIRKDRVVIHEKIKKLEETGMKTKEIYDQIFLTFGYEFHAGNIRTVMESLIIKEFLDVLLKKRLFIDNETEN